MIYLKPKRELKKKQIFKVSDEAVQILPYYSKYVRRSIDEIVDYHIRQLAEDPEFISWIEKQRYKIRILELIGKISNHGEQIDDKNHNSSMFSGSKIQLLKSAKLISAPLRLALRRLA